MIIWFFFFKQKTAYEMRISDWSSDVCSSDLPFFLKPKKKNGASTSSARTDLGGDADLTLAALGEGQRHERDDEEQDHRAAQRRQRGKQQRARRAARMEFHTIGPPRRASIVARRAHMSPIDQRGASDRQSVW